MTLTELYITEEMISKIKSDLDFFRTVSCSKVRCENEAVYDKLMDWYSQLHIATYGNREDLTIFA
jgi:hypothetical protein